MLSLCNGILDVTIIKKNDLFIIYVTTFYQKAIVEMYIVYVRSKFEMFSFKLDRLETYYKIIIIMNYNNILMVAKS